MEIYVHSEPVRAFRKRVPVIALLLFSSALACLCAEEHVQFRFKHRPGEQYRIVGVNKQEVYTNGDYSGTAEILTRILIEVLEDDRIGARYEISEEMDSGTDVFAADREHSVTFERAPSGVLNVPSDSFVPQVRNIPTFPEEALSPGDTWERPAIEVYDFREGLGIDEPVRIPVDVMYEYVGPTDFEGYSREELRIRYNLFHRPGDGDREAAEIRLMTARFSQRYLWDAAAGRPVYYDETYNLFVQFVDGTRFELRGSADGRVVDAPALDRDGVEQDIAQSILDLNLSDTTVRTDEKGVTIALEDIRFAPDSAELLESELEKLDWIASVLQKHPDRDVLITGHTAKAGTPEGRKHLSEERAAAVGRYLIEMGVRSRDSLMYRGVGATEPIADNDTPEGRRRNRRVEITIREN